jgi:uncharacterized protein DUF4124
MLRTGVHLAVVLALCTVVSIAQARVYKCKDSDGKTTYSDLPCGPESKPLKLSEESKGKATDPHMCQQLLDETNRLAAEANRDTKTSRTQRSANADKRKALTRQYEARCVGISRSK